MTGFPFGLVLYHKTHYNTYMLEMTPKMALAGKAVFTAKQKTTGKHYVFRVVRKPPKDKYKEAFFLWVREDRRWVYVGKLNPVSGYVYKTEASTHSEHIEYEADGKTPKRNPLLAARKILPALWANRLPETIEIMPAHACMRCGKRMTVTEGILGPDCAKLVNREWVERNALWEKQKNTPAETSV